MPAFHTSHLGFNCADHCQAHEGANPLPLRDRHFTNNSGPPLAINPSQERIRLVASRTNSFFCMSRKFYRGETTGDNSASQENHDD
jgi:hypothetical protein